MRILVLGGTVFVGRHLVEAALRRGHELTLFNRGQTAPSLFGEVEQLRGDRAGDLAALRGRSFDAVCDVNGYLPRDVRASASLLADEVGRYLFVSSRSVYADTATPGLDESASVAELPAGAPQTDVSGESYGPLKALCERAVVDEFEGRAIVLRPGLIVGPHDPTNRFAYWPRRIAAGGEVLAPAPPDAPVQVIDVRDLAAFALDLLERERDGAYDVVAPDGALSLGGVLDACARVAEGDAEIIWVDEEFLLERGVEPWTELPLWTPGPDYAGFQRADGSRALAAGLQIRPIDETVRDVLAGERARAGRALPAPRFGSGGPLDAAKEQELLAAFRLAS